MRQPSLHGLVEGVKLMNNAIKKIFIDTYETEMEKLGFSRKGIVFHRLVNDEITQLLSYKTYAVGCDYTIQFSFLPLCNGHKIDRWAGFDCQFVLERFIRSELNLTNIQKEESRYLQLFAESLDLCKEHIFPLFNRVTNYQSYWEFIKDIYKVDEEINDRLYCENIYIPLNPYFYLLLKLGRYEEALLAGEARILLWNNSYPSKEMEKHPRYLERIKIRDDLMKTMDLLLKKDYEAINAILAEKENESYQSYVKQFKKT